MVGKLTAALIRKEAEAYRAQGLHEEAFALYDELLSSSPNIDEALKSDIQSQMDSIAEEMEAFSNHKEAQLISSKELKQLKDGWKDSASTAEILISAQDLCQIGAHQDALVEFAKLLENGVAPEKIADSAAECFASIHGPKNTPIAVEKWLRGIYSETKKVLAVHLLIIRALSRRDDKAYALQYCSYIRSKPRLPARLVKRLDAAKAKYELAIQRSKKKIKSKIKSTIRHRMDSTSKTKTANKQKPSSKIHIAEDTEKDALNKTINNDNDRLKTLFADNGMEDILDEDQDPSVSYSKKKPSQLHFLKLITVGWLHWVFGGILFRKKKR